MKTLRDRHVLIDVQCNFPLPKVLYSPMRVDRLRKVQARLHSERWPFPAAIAESTAAGLKPTIILPLISVTGIEEVGGTWARTNLVCSSA